MRWLPKHIGREPYVHLAWLSYLVVQPIFDPASGVFDWLLIALMLSVFLPVYLWIWTHEQRRRRRDLWGVGAMALLDVIFAPINSGSSAFFIYAAAALAYFLPPRAAARASRPFRACLYQRLFVRGAAALRAHRLYVSGDHGPRGRRAQHLRRRKVSGQRRAAARP